MVLDGCMMFENSSFEQLCRICSEKGEGTNVFSEDGVSNNLASKMKKYLDIQVSAIRAKLVQIILFSMLNLTKMFLNVLSFVANYIVVLTTVYLLLFLLKRLCQP